MADFLLKLYHSNYVIGLVNRESFEFELSSPLFNYSGNTKNNQKSYAL